MTKSLGLGEDPRSQGPSAVASHLPAAEPAPLQSRGCIRFLGSKAPEPGHPKEQKSPGVVEAKSPIPTWPLVSLHSSTYCLCVFLFQALLVPYV